MEKQLLWQPIVLDFLVRKLQQFEEVLAVVLKGSLAGDRKNVDIWSDIDLIVFMEGDEDHLYASLDWLAELGPVFAIERYAHGPVQTLRVCLSELRRMDLVFVTGKEVGVTVSLNELVGDKFKLLLGKLDGLEEQAVKPDYVESTLATPYQVVEQQILTMGEGFWFKGISAVAKLARKDYLIASHLAMEMAQETIVLQMIQRDIRKGTTIHRTGDAEKVLAFEDMIVGPDGTDDQIIRMLTISGKRFDELAAIITAQYKPRFSEFQKWIDRLKGNECPQTGL